MDGILFRRVEVDRIDDDARELEPVATDGDHLAERVLGSIIVRSLLVRDQPVLGRLGGLIHTQLRRNVQGRSLRDEILAVRGELHAGHIQGFVRQRRDDSLRGDLVQGLADVEIVPLGGEIDGAVLFRADQGDAPVRAVGQAADRAVITQEIDLLPARLEGADHRRRGPCTVPSP